MCYQLNVFVLAPDTHNIDISIVDSPFIPAVQHIVQHLQI